MAGVRFRQRARSSRHLPHVAPSDHLRSEPANHGVEVAWIWTALYMREAKIDAAIALLMAIGRAQASEGDGAEDVTAFLLNPVMG